MADREHTYTPPAMREEAYCTQCGHPAVWAPPPAYITHADPALNAGHPVELAWRARAEVTP